MLDRQPGAGRVPTRGTVESGAATDIFAAALGLSVREARPCCRQTAIFSGCGLGGGITARSDPSSYHIYF